MVGMAGMVGMVGMAIMVGRDPNEATMEQKNTGRKFPSQTRVQVGISTSGDRTLLQNPSAIGFGLSDGSGQSANR
jgi:hypothetical protein